MSVNRYDIDAYSYFEAANWTLVESAVGDFVYAFDYDELRERVAWMLECDCVHIWVMIDCPSPSDDNFNEIADECICARKAVEELL